MIDILRIWFREYVRDSIPTLATFSWGTCLGASIYSPYGAWAWGFVSAALLLMVWDLWLKRGEVKRRKEELYEYYRSEFETEKFRPVRHAAEGWDRPREGGYTRKGSYAEKQFDVLENPPPRGPGGVTKPTLDKGPK